MSGPVARQQAVDSLKNVEFAAVRPGGAIADRVTEQPEGGPDALLGAGVVGAEADLALGHGAAAGGRREGVLGLDPARSPGGAVEPGDELQRVAAAHLHVARVPRVHLELVVDAQVARDDVPPALVRRLARRARERVRPDQPVPVVVRRSPSQDTAAAGAEDGQNREVRSEVHRARWETQAGGRKKKNQECIYNEKGIKQKCCVSGYSTSKYIQGKGEDQCG